MRKISGWVGGAAAGGASAGGAGGGNGASNSAASNGHADEVGHNVDLPAEVLLDSNTVLSDHYAEVTGAPCSLFVYRPEPPLAFLGTTEPSVQGEAQGSRAAGTPVSALLRAPLGWHCTLGTPAALCAACGMHNSVQKAPLKAYLVRSHTCCYPDGRCMWARASSLLASSPIMCANVS